MSLLQVVNVSIYYILYNILFVAQMVSSCLCVWCMRWFCHFWTRFSCKINCL